MFRYFRRNFCFSVLHIPKPVEDCFPRNRLHFRASPTHWYFSLNGFFLKKLFLRFVHHSRENQNEEGKDSVNIGRPFLYGLARGLVRGLSDVGEDRFEIPVTGLAGVNHINDLLKGLSPRRSVSLDAFKYGYGGIVDLNIRHRHDRF